MPASKYVHLRNGEEGLTTMMYLRQNLLFVARALVLAMSGMHIVETMEFTSRNAGVLHNALTIQAHHCAAS